MQCFILSVSASSGPTDIKCVPESQGSSPTHTVTGKILLAAEMVMQVLNTTCSQWPCSTQSSEFQDKGRVKVMFISSWASRPARKQGEHNRLLQNEQGKNRFLIISFKRKPQMSTMPVSLASIWVFTFTDLFCWCGNNCLGLAGIMIKQPAGTKRGSYSSEAIIRA